jgi:glycosyltransferase involved in cell wall biosynthesis
MPSTTIPTVSVIIPAYCVTQYIADAVQSVVTQTFRDFEIIVVNDGCPDTRGLDEELQPYSANIVYIKKPNGGLASARNAGLRVARAPLVAFLDADDIWEPDYLQIQISILQHDPTIDVVYPNAVSFGESSRSGCLWMDSCPSFGDVTFTSLVSSQCSVLYSVTARAEIISRVGGFDERLRRCEDFDLWLRIAKAGGRFAYHTRPLVRYRRRDGSLSSNGVEQERTALQVLENAEQTLDLSTDERRALALAKSDLRYKILLIQAITALDQRDVDSAIHAYRKLRRLRPSLSLYVRVMLLQVCPRLLFSVRDLIK